MDCRIFSCISWLPEERHLVELCDSRLISRSSSSTPPQLLANSLVPLSLLITTRSFPVWSFRGHGCAGAFRVHLSVGTTINQTSSPSLSSLFSYIITSLPIPPRPWSVYYPSIRSEHSIFQSRLVPSRFYKRNRTRLGSAILILHGCQTTSLSIPLTKAVFYSQAYANCDSTNL